jgi:hypothetical protein
VTRVRGGLQDAAALREHIQFLEAERRQFRTLALQEEEEEEEEERSPEYQVSHASNGGGAGWGERTASQRSSSVRRF